ncbi:CAP domain-containing protein [Chytriomyces sp. MP71]|nr:CAP domain-containing protein [Chytriomyces sp. MP71]
MTVGNFMPFLFSINSFHLTIGVKFESEVPTRHEFLNFDANNRGVLPPSCVLSKTQNVSTSKMKLQKSIALPMMATSLSAQYVPPTPSTTLHVSGGSVMAPYIPPTPPATAYIASVVAPATSSVTRRKCKPRGTPSADGNVAAATTAAYAAPSVAQVVASATTASYVPSFPSYVAPPPAPAYVAPQPATTYGPPPLEPAATTSSDYAVQQTVQPDVTSEAATTTSQAPPSEPTPAPSVQMQVDDTATVAPAPAPQVEVDTAATTQTPQKTTETVEQPMKQSKKSTGGSGRAGGIPDCNQIDSITSSYQSTGVIAQDAVNLSNAVRQYVGGVIGVDMPEITWNDNMALGAAQHAQYSVRNNCGLTHNVDPTSYFPNRVGQNLYARYGGGVGNEAAMAVASIAGWVGLTECNAYNNRNSFQDTFETWGHYSQVLAPQSVQIGCASVPCGSGVVVACDYYPPGNNGNGATIRIGNGY